LWGSGHIACLLLKAFLNSKAKLTESVHSQSLSLGQSQCSGILPLCTLCLGPNNILVCSVFLSILSNASRMFSHDLVGSNCVAVLGLCGVCLWTEPQDQLASGTLLYVNLSVGDGFIMESLGIASF
jgi:hypothetical protein